MHWMSGFGLILLDLDGLLVNTEELHFRAYQIMCKNRGFPLPWDFQRYCQAVHYEATGPRDNIYATFPKLKEIEPNWEPLYLEKKKAYMDLLKGGSVHLMPGAKEFLQKLKDLGLRHCVVTHSPIEQVEVIREHCKELNSIPDWFTRNDYKKPKPDPEGYLLAINKLGKGESVLGFEDTPRGLSALKRAGVKPVLVTSIEYPNMEEILEGGVVHYSSLSEVLEMRPV